MTYRNCKITPDPFRGQFYTWEHPDRADYDPETGSQWSGYGSSIEECMAQIDEWYEDSERQ
jgi:hypothetical protein